MKFTTTTMRTAIGAAGIAAVSLAAAGTASAAPNIQGFGTSEPLIDGPMVTNYTVSNLQPSTIVDSRLHPEGNAVPSRRHRSVGRRDRHTAGARLQRSRAQRSDLQIDRQRRGAERPQPGAHRPGQRVEGDAVLRRDRRPAERCRLQRRTAGHPDVDVEHPGDVAEHAGYASSNMSGTSPNMPGTSAPGEPGNTGPAPGALPAPATT